jgi:signal transduction histidine kinase
MTRLQTVYETGSRLTHDLKNMLQSLFSLTSIAQSRAESAQQLLLQQLPLLTQRIEMVLVKLQQPQVEDETPQLALKVWWDTLKLRNRHRTIKWLAPEALPDMKIPSALFDCVIDNLVDNATRKLQSDPGVVISIELQLEPLRLTVCDTGEAASQSIAVNLMRGVVASENGLGIGLYQAARWAAQLGYRLMLVSNQKGKVCFELRDLQGEPERRNLNF